MRKSPTRNRRAFTVTAYAVGVSLLLVIVGEITARISAPYFAHGALKYMLADKKLHCLESDGITIGLCPNVRLHLHHPRGFDYRITTNALGERVTRCAPITRREKRIWVLGDSIAMGFGVHDRETFPYLLSQRTRSSVRNLGVDGLGARAVLKRFRRARKQGKRPDLVFRIVHPSDFVDDERDRRLENSSIRRFMFRGHFFLARHLALYNWVRWLFKYRHVGPPTPKAKAQPKRRTRKLPRKKPVTAIQPSPADLKHPTFHYTEILIREAKAARIPLTFVIYPAWNGAAGRPRSDYGDLRGLPEFVRTRGVKVVDLGRAFRNAPNPRRLYIPDDGHPSANAAKVFLRELSRASGELKRDEPPDSPPREKSCR